MTIALRSAGIHHLTLRSTDLARSKAFYGGTLGLPIVMETQELFVALAGATAIAVRGPDTLTPEGDRFNPFRVGLDHVALGCSHEDELERVAAGLECAGVPSTGLTIDPPLQRRYVAFKDPDAIAWDSTWHPMSASRWSSATSRPCRQETWMAFPCGRRQFRGPAGGPGDRPHRGA
jgi:glyoxylase I family protein